jgi:hypothetical protein
MGHGARPAHPDHRRFGMIAELLRYPFGAACAAERPDGRGDGLLDLVHAGFIRALQRRHKEGVGSERADADGVLSWPHSVPLLRVMLIGGCVPVIVSWRGPRSHPPGVQAKMASGGLALAVRLASRPGLAPRERIQVDG